MLVVDTSAFISLAVGDVHRLLVDEFDIRTTQVVREELAETADYDDSHGIAASRVLEIFDNVTVVSVTGQSFLTSRIDHGEASCVEAVRQADADFLVTDDFRALPEMRELVDAEVALCPIVLQALVKRDVISETDATKTLEEIARGRDWLETPLYRYGRQILE